MVPGFHGLDLLVILVVALLIFGPKRLPEMGSAIGKSIKEFRKGMNELTSPKDDELPFSAASSAASLEAIEREIASKRAAAATAEAERAQAASGTTGETSTETKSTEQPVE